MLQMTSDDQSITFNCHRALN